MVTTDTIEGTINGTISYHYDIAADVLYLRLLRDMDTESISEETDEGLINLIDDTTGRIIGTTIVSWWKRFGVGSLPDSIQEIQQQIEPLAGKIAA